MAGVAGKGGSGGARPGAGRPRKPVEVLETHDSDPVKFLLAVMEDVTADIDTRVRAANYAAPYFHAKKAGGGVKESRATAAKSAGSGKFSPSASPKLAATNP